MKRERITTLINLFNLYIVFLNNGIHPCLFDPVFFTILANKFLDNLSRFYEVFVVEINGFSQRNNDSLLVNYLHPGLLRF